MIKGEDIENESGEDEEMDWKKVDWMEELNFTLLYGRSLWTIRLKYGQVKKKFELQSL